MDAHSSADDVDMVHQKQLPALVPGTGDQSSARDALIEEHLPLVKWVVRRMLVESPGELDREDLVGFGTIGLIQAVDRFDASQGVAFRTYAVSRIRGAIIDALRAVDRLPRSVRQKAERYAAVESQLTADGAQPSREELAAAMGMTLTEYETMRVDCSWQTVSLDEMLDGPNSDGGDAVLDVGSHHDDGHFSARLSMRRRSSRSRKPSLPCRRAN